jgi:epoxyqueuosine reductase
MTIAAPHIRPGNAEGTALLESMRRIAEAVGVDVVGFGNLEEALPPGFRHLPRGIALGVVHPLLRRLKEDPRGLTETAVVEALADHRDRESQVILEQALHDLGRHLREQGYRYFSCPPDCDPMELPFSSRVTRTFSHKAAATCAGLGWVGRHGLLNHPEYGPHVTWATLLTNAPLPTSDPTTTDMGICGTCRKCAQICPGGAISGRSWRRADGMVSLVDTERCRSVLEENERTTGRWVCGRCAVTCTLAQLTAGGLIR